MISTTNVDLESVLNVGRRTLKSIGESSSSLQQGYTDIIYIKREDHSKSIYSIESKIVISGELQFLCYIFERYTSNVSIHEDGGNDLPSNRTSFSITFEENENIEQETENNNISTIVSKLRQTSISSQSSSPPKISDSPIDRQKFNSISRSQTTTSTTSDYSRQNLEGKRYGSIEIFNMTIIEILEILFRAGLELVNQFSDYDNENVLHQTFIFIQIHHTGQRLR